MRRMIFPYILIFPLVIIMLGLVFYPAAVTFVDSFKSINLTRPYDVKFVGFSNYIELFNDPTVLRTAYNSALYFIFAVAGEMIGGLLIALALRNKFKGRGLVLAAVIIPWSLPPVVNGVIWKWIYDPSYGVLNDILLKLGVISSYQVWLGQASLSLILVTIVHIWKMIPLTVVILLASLQTISNDLYESAQIDGASRSRSFWHITLPLLKPAIVISLTQATFAAINLFDEIFVLTGTALDTRSILIQNYLIAFRKLELGLGMSLSLIITVITLGITLVYLILMNERGTRKS